MDKYAKLIKSLRCNGDGIAEEDDGLGCANKKCKYRDADGACDLTSMTLDAAAITAIQAENAALLNEIRGYCWCCAHAEIWDKALPGSLTRTCKFLRERGVAAGGGRRKCPHWTWRGAQGEG